MSLVALFKRNGPSGFGYTSTADAVTAGLDLSDEHACINAHRQSADGRVAAERSPLLPKIPNNHRQYAPGRDGVD